MVSDSLENPYVSLRQSQGGVDRIQGRKDEILKVWALRTGIGVEKYHIRLPVSGQTAPTPVVHSSMTLSQGKFESNYFDQS